MSEWERERKRSAAADLSEVPTSALVGEIERRLRCRRAPERRLVLVGAPGAGKGTQALRIAKRYCLCRIPIGDMLRAAVASGSPLGRQASSAMNSGQLVRDDLVTSILEERLRDPACRRGFVIDGFPRTVNQAQKLDGMLEASGQSLDAAVELKVDPRIMLERVSGRLIHSSSGRSYHPKFNPPRVPETDDITGERLIHRNDDNPDTFRKRYESYTQKTKPVVDYYRNQGKLKEVDGSGPVVSTFELLRRYVDQL